MKELCQIDSNDMLITSNFESIDSVESTSIANGLRDPNIDYNLESNMLKR